MSKVIKYKVLEWTVIPPQFHDKDQKDLFTHLRPIAQRQIQSLLQRMVLTRNYTLYKTQIRKIIQYERENGDVNSHD